MGVSHESVELGTGLFRAGGPEPAHSPMISQPRGSAYRPTESLPVRPMLEPRKLSCFHKCKRCLQLCSLCKWNLLCFGITEISTSVCKERAKSVIKLSLQRWIWARLTLRSIALIEPATARFCTFVIPCRLFFSSGRT